MNLFNFLSGKKEVTDQPTESEKLASNREQTFTALSALITPQMIAEIRSGRTAEKAQSEGLETIKNDRTEELALVFKRALSYVIENSSSMQGAHAINSVNLEAWLERTAYRTGHELSELMYGHGPSGGKEASIKRLQEMMGVSPEIANAFQSFKSHYYYSGAQVNFSRDAQSQEPLLERELCSVFYDIIAQRPIGDVSPLIYAEFKEVAKSNRALG